MSKKIAAPAPAEVLPENSYNAYYFEKEYELSEFISRSREDAKAETIRLRSEGKLAVLTTLKDGWVGVLWKEAPAREPKASKSAPKPKPPVEFQNLKFGSTTEARAFARELLELCRNAEFEADQQAALESKTEA